MTARILAYTYNGNPAYLPNWDGPPILTSQVGASILANWDRRPQNPDLREGHNGARALGWVRRIWQQEDGLYAFIELNTEGEELIANNTYKYVSPSLAKDITLPSGDTLEGWYIMHIALTNDPAQYGGATIIDMRRDPNTIAYTIALHTDRAEQEDTNMSEPTTEQIKQAVIEAIQPLHQMISRQLQQLQLLQQQEEDRTIADLQREIESWRYDDNRAIPPAVAQQWAVILSRIPPTIRTDAIAALRNNPPQLVRLARHAQPATAAKSDTDPLTQKYLAQLGVSTDTYIKYKEVNHASANQ